MFPRISAASSSELEQQSALDDVEPLKLESPTMIVCSSLIVTCLVISLSLCLLAMIIGFTQRIRTVSEGQVPGVDLFQLEIDVESVRTAEREHPMQFRLQESSTNATVEPLIASSPAFDATFGLRANLDDPIEETRDLDPGIRVVTPSLLTAIRNDLTPEDLECYTIRIFPVDVPGRRELFECNEDTAMADNYFCEHTICIEDNDGEILVCFSYMFYVLSWNFCRSI